MIQSLHLQKIRTAALFAVVGLLVVSCGSYQQASYYDTDGIYGANEPRVTVERAPRQTPQVKQKKGDNTYTDYFGQKADQYGEILEGEIFTDVDSYSSGVENDSISEVDLTEYYTSDNDYAGNGGWGDNPTSVNINIYDNGWNNWGWGGAGFGWGWNDPWLWNGGWGWNNWGYGGYGWGWNRWNRWNRWGWGGWNNWGYGGWGWNNWGWANNWGYGNRGYAYNSSRRGYYNNNRPLTRTNSRTSFRGRSNLNTSRSATASRYRI